MKTCRNCDTPMLYDAGFCPSCGQKFTDGKNPLWGIFKEFLDAVFSFESRTLKSLTFAFVPGLLTKNYFQGKQIGFMHPLRIFLLSASIFLAVFGYRVSNFFSDRADKIEKTVHEFSVKQKIYNRLDSIYSNFNSAYPDALNDIERENLQACLTESFDSEINLDSFNLKYTGLEMHNVPVNEFYNGNVDTLASKYGADSPIEKLMMGQMIRFMKSPNSFIQTTVGNLIWMILLLMPAVALVLKLLYARRQSYFVEHLVFSFHYHSFIFLLLAFGQAFYFDNKLVVFGLLFGCLVFLLLAMKRYYSQTVFKTFFKWAALLLGYVFIFSLFFLIMIIASFFTF